MKKKVNNRAGKNPKKIIPTHSTKNFSPRVSGSSDRPYGDHFFHLLLPHNATDAATSLTRIRNAIDRTFQRAPFEGGKGRMCACGWAITHYIPGPAQLTQRSRASIRKRHCGHPVLPRVKGKKCIRMHRSAFVLVCVCVKVVWTRDEWRERERGRFPPTHLIHRF